MNTASVATGTEREQLATKGDTVSQAVMREIIDGALKRIERDHGGIPIKLYPFTRHSIKNAPATVLIDPALSGGRPVISGTGLATRIIAERYKLGESISNAATHRW